MYKPKCQSVKPQAPKDIAYTHCEKDQGHPGDHYGNDTHNHLLDTSMELVMTSWSDKGPAEPSDTAITGVKLPQNGLQGLRRTPHTYETCSWCNGTAAHE